MEDAELERLRQLLIRDCDLTTTPQPTGVNPADFFAARQQMIPLLEALTGKRLGPQSAVRLIMDNMLVTVFTAARRGEELRINSISYSRHYTV
jgi:hypothetical protein